MTASAPTKMTPEQVFTAAAALHQAGQPARALPIYQAVLKVLPEHDGALVNVGSCLSALDQPDKAVAWYRAVLARRPELDAARLNLARLLEHRGDAAAAEAEYRAILIRHPELDAALGPLGQLLQYRRDLSGAEQCYRRILARQPDQPRWLHNLALVLRDLDRPAEAVPLLQRVTELGPDLKDSWVALGNALREVGRYEDSIPAYQRALALDGTTLPALRGLGRAYWALCRWDEARAAFARGLTLHPGDGSLHMFLGMEHLRRGALLDGWTEMEWRRFIGTNGAAAPAEPAPPWLGQPLAGRTLLLIAEAGFGDTLHFVRYAPLAAQRGARVVMQVQASLVRLLRAMPGVAEVAGLHQPAPRADFCCSLITMPLMMGTHRLEDIPAAVPYIPVPEAAVAAWDQRLGPRRGLRVGLVWAGNPRRHFRHRSARLATFAPLAAVPGIQWVSLQTGPAAAEAATPPAGMALADLSANLDDFADTAALIATLDLVITIDTSVAHLAGALGRPTWVILSHPPCWRWLLDRSDSPWYPTMRLFRQPAHDDWGAVVEDVAAALAERVAAAPGAP